jgi:hypothetical protein
METAERNQLIARLLHEGNTLAQVQKLLEEEHDVKLTYMDLRLISSDLEVNWSKFDPPEPEPEPEPKAESDDPDEPTTGQTIINVSKLQRPGAMFSGDVTFKSGVKSEWHVDTMGRLGLNPIGDERPTEEDLQDFQKELQGAVQGKM